MFGRGIRLGRAFSFELRIDFGLLFLTIEAVGDHRLAHGHALEGALDPLILVSDGERLVGLVHIDAIDEVPSEERARTPVRAIMTPRDEIAVLAPGAPAAEALREMARRDAELLPVADADDQPRGMLRLHDIARWVRLHSGDGPPLSPAA